MTLQQIKNKVKLLRLKSDPKAEKIVKGLKAYESGQITLQSLQNYFIQIIR